MGPFTAILFTNFSQMGRVAGVWSDTAGRGLQSLLLLPGPPTDVTLHGGDLLALGGGGGGGVGDTDLCGRETKGGGGGAPLYGSFKKDGGG